VKDTFTAITEKLIRRHPHVFPQSDTAKIFDKIPETPEKVLEQWDKIKETIEGRKKNYTLDEVDSSLPPLLQAFKLQKKAAKKGFDWENADGPRKKIFEELNEIEDAISSEGNIEEECGDLLFSIVNYCRKLNVNPESALIAANHKFKNRFRYIEDALYKDNRTVEQASLAEMDALWNEAK
jgi:tetrapyrrole methylase family protein/MazG family protein